MSPIISRINGTGGMIASMGFSSSKLIFPSPQIFISTGIVGGVSIVVPNLATSMKFKVWGSGGDGVGEGCGGPYSGGSGGYVEGVYPVSKGQTVTVYVGATGAAGGGALVGSGAGAGGEGSLILYNGSFVAVAGGGGGSGQAGNGGSGGGNGSGGSGTRLLIQHTMDRVEHNLVVVMVDLDLMEHPLVAMEVEQPGVLLVEDLLVERD